MKELLSTDQTDSLNSIASFVRLASLETVESDHREYLEILSGQPPKYILVFHDGKTFIIDADFKFQCH